MQDNPRPLILHLTHTDVRSDARILKSLAAGSDGGFKTYGIGFTARKSESNPPNATTEGVLTLSLRCSQLDFLPKTILLGASLIELTLKLIRSTLKYQPRVIHCHDTIALPAAVIVKLIKKSKLVYDSHELASKKNSQSRFIGYLTYIIEKICWPCIDVQIVVSDSIGHWYKTNMGQKTILTIFNAPIPTNQARYSKRYLRDKYQLGSETKIFLYIGKLGAGRGIPLLVEAFRSSSSDAILVFLGFGEYSEWLSTLSLEKNSKIFVHPPVAHDEVIAVASSADVGICLIENTSLSYYFSLPNKLFECAFAGIPVIASPFPEMKKLIDKYQMGMTCPLDVGAVQSAIENIQLSSFQIDMSSLSDISWSAQATKLQKCYQQLSGFTPA